MGRKISGSNAGAQRPPPALWRLGSARLETCRISLIRGNDGEKGGKQVYQVEGYAHGPDVSTAQHDPIVPIILQFEIRRGRTRLSRIESALRFGIDVHVPLFLVAAAAAAAVGAILDGSGPRHACVPQRGSGGHEECVVDVPGVGEDREVEREEPALAAWDDAEVRGTQRGVREHVVQRRAVVVLQVFQRGRGEVRIRGGRTFLMQLSFSAFFSSSLYAGWVRRTRIRCIQSCRLPRHYHRYRYC